MRFAELDDCVDFFVLVEAKHTLAGIPKPLFFDQNRELFVRYLPKIIHVALPSLPPIITDDEPSRFWLERFQRNAVLLGLLSCNPQADDLVLLSDVDEIPSRSGISAASDLLADNDVVDFKQTAYYYWLDRAEGPDPKRWIGTVATRYKSFARILPQELRRGWGRAGCFEGVLNIAGDSVRRASVENGGWHLTYFGGKHAELYKKVNFAHGAGNVCGNARVVQPVAVSRSSAEGLLPLTPQLLTTITSYVRDVLHNDVPTSVGRHIEDYYHLFQVSYEQNSASKLDDPDTPEVYVDLRGVRALRSIDATPWTGGGRAYWLVWEHIHERDQSFSAIVQDLALKWGRFIQPGSTCIDIGSHSGDTTIPMGLLAYDRKWQKKGHIFAVEPNPDILPLLASTLTLNAHIANFGLGRYAVTPSEMPEVELADHGNANNNGGIIEGFSDYLTEQLVSRAKHHYKVPGRSLEGVISDACQGLDPASLQFIKIDCEGYDKEIIRSGRQALSQIKPVLYVEWFGLFSAEDDADFFKAIKEAGYIAFDPVRLTEVDGSVRIPDVICLHKDTVQTLMPRSKPLTASGSTG
jgi:FkbM family methyltransferase